MTRPAVRRTILAAMLFASVAPAFAAHAADAAAADPRYTWNLQDLYPSEAAWVAAKDAAVKELPQLESCRGHLGESAARLLGCLDTVFDLDRRLAQVGVYATMNFDLDTKVGRAQQMQE